MSMHTTEGKQQAKRAMTAMDKFGTMGHHLSACIDRGPLATYWRISSNQQETGVDKWDVEDDGLNRI